MRSSTGAYGSPSGTASPTKIRGRGSVRCSPSPSAPGLPCSGCTAWSRAAPPGA
jgi:hypothetical protein